MRVTVVCVSALALASCSSNIIESVAAPPQAIYDHAAACAAAPPDMTPAGYAFAGIDFVDEQCGVFFDSIIELQKNARYTSSSIASGSATTATILGLVKASAVSIAIVAAGSELARKLVESYAAEFAFAPYALETRQLVLEAMGLYLKDRDAVVPMLQYLSTARATADNFCNAQRLVRNYARICSISGVEALAKQAVANSKILRRDPSGQSRQADSFSQRALRAPTAQEAARFRSFAFPSYVAGSR